MKLLEILQKELKEFPKGTLYAVQDNNGEVKFGKHSQPKLCESGIWQRREDGLYPNIGRLELAEDWDSSIVTKDMWEKHKMKQIIVNVSGLSVGEKTRVHEALEKIIASTKAPERSATLWSKVGSMYGPSSLGHHVGLDFYNRENPTHTPQEVLEMAGMRKVRKDFDPEQPISVDVSSCTEEEKKEVQQAFFDVGIEWMSEFSQDVGVASFRYLDAELYTNSTTDGTCHGYLMYGTVSRTDSISHQQFLSMVYEPEQQGHIHADLMALYAEDAKTTDKPWELWQIKDVSVGWRDLKCNPSFATHLEYRRKSKTKLIHGVEVPDISFTPNDGEDYVYPDIYGENYASGSRFYSGYEASEMALKAGCCYPPTEEGTQAAILHAKIMLGII